MKKKELPSHLTPEIDFSELVPKNMLHHITDHEKNLATILDQLRKS